MNNDKIQQQPSLETQRCPYCAELINREAIKCKHCGSILKQPKSNSDATAALVLGLLGFITGITSIFAIIYGIIGIRVAKKHPERGGRGRAVAGLTLGIISLIVIFFLVVSLVGLGNARDEARNSNRMADANSIMTAIELYKYDNGSLPQNLTDLTADYLEDIPVDPETSATYEYLVYDDCYGVVVPLKKDYDSYFVCTDGKCEETNSPDVCK